MALPDGDGPGGAFVNQEASDWERFNVRVVLRWSVGGRLLDVGANTGGLLDLLRRAGRSDLLGMEPNPACAAQARRRGLDVRVGWFMREQVPAAPLGTIVMSHVPGAHPRPSGALELCRDRLDNGGRLLLFVPNAGSWRARNRLANWSPLNPATHLWHFTPRTLRSLLERHSGMTLRELTTSRLHRPKFRSPKRLFWTISDMLAPALRRRRAVDRGAGEGLRPDWWTG